MGRQATVLARDLIAAGAKRLEDKVSHIPNCPECFGDHCDNCGGPDVIREAVWEVNGIALVSYLPDDLYFDCKVGGTNDLTIIPLLIAAGVPGSKIRYS